MRKHKRAWDGLSACFEALEARTLMAADMVLTWNEVAVEATRVARLMVTQLGMSERLGPVFYRQHDEHIFLGKEIHEPRDFSEGTAKIIDEEVHRIITAALDRASEMVRTHRDKLDRLTEALLVHEELDAEEVDKVFAGVPITEVKKEPPKAEVPAATETKPEVVVAPEPTPPPGLAYGGVLITIWRGMRWLGRNATGMRDYRQ